jgi:hypothetical protein
MKELIIWRLVESGRYCSFIPDNLSFFSDKFNCVSLVNDWKIPPAKISGRSFPLADFVSWMHKAPVVSERAKDLIENLVGNDVEFLHFHSLKKKPYFVMNVLKSEELLDFDRSVMTPIREKYYFRDISTYNLPPLFKCVGFYEQIFVTRPFAEMIISNHLKGAILADPSEEVMPLIVAGRSINRYPGLVT